MQQPEVAHQMQFTDGGEEGEDDLDEHLEIKDEQTETALNDFFPGSAPPRERERETRHESANSSLMADRRTLEGSRESEQVQIVHDVEEGQQTLEGEEATGQFTRTIRKAKEDEAA